MTTESERAQRAMDDFLARQTVTEPRPLPWDERIVLRMLAVVVIFALVVLYIFVISSR